MPADLSSRPGSNRREAQWLLEDLQRRQGGKDALWCAAWRGTQHQARGDQRLQEARAGSWQSHPFIVRRDLELSNNLGDAGGRAWVMGFGISARLAADAAVDPFAGWIVGTSDSLSPEAANAAPASGQVVVSAAGLEPSELLGGRWLLLDNEPRAALRLVLGNNELLPDSAEADDRLRGIVQRAIARDSADRDGNAAGLRVMR